MLDQLDSVFALASRIAFGLERTTSTKIALIIAGLMPSRQQILRNLRSYMMRKRRPQLTGDLSIPVHRNYVLPLELGRT